MQCRNCGLENPASAQWCDCGHVFATGNCDIALRLPERAGLWQHPVVIVLSALVLALLVFAPLYYIANSAPP
ncbi:MAG: hypothetical protein JNK87_05750 [Bryobacterales bacterium]|nr:hypothetical protein [Bryobacterales bacterium]